MVRQPVAVSRQPEQTAETLAKDYWQACEWFGNMPFEEFAAGYRAMEAWQTTRGVETHGSC